MAYKQGTTVEGVAEQGAGLVFVVYPEAIATLTGSVFWAIIFFLMLITLGLDSTFGGLEALITGVCDEWPIIRKKRELFVFVLIIYCFVGALSTTTYGGQYVLNLLDSHGAPISILFICFLEAIAVNWFYGVNRFANDIQEMLGYRPGWFWLVCWAGISPIFLLVLFVLSIVKYEPIQINSYKYPEWATTVGWLITASSIVCIPIYMIYRLLTSKGSFKMRLKHMIEPEELPVHCRDVQMIPVRL
jgi:solute carrier family 6 serotonin transporter-like protein 4